MLSTIWVHPFHPHFLLCPFRFSAPSVGRMDTLLPESRVTPTSGKGGHTRTSSKPVHNPRAGGCSLCYTPAPNGFAHWMVTSRFMLDFSFLLCSQWGNLSGRGGPLAEVQGSSSKEGSLRFSTCMCPRGPGLGFTSLTGPNPHCHEIISLGQLV